MAHCSKGLGATHSLNTTTNVPLKLVLSAPLIHHSCPMNPSESVLYPTSYYRDMASFTAQFLCHKFDKSRHPNFDKAMLVESAHENFSSEWDLNLYCMVLRTFLLAECDESLIVGTVVLLDLLQDLADESQRRHEERDTTYQSLNLPRYPHDDYIDLFAGAFMLAYRLLNRNRSPIRPRHWVRILGGICPDARVMQLEDNIRSLLEDHINLYKAPPLNEEDDHIRIVYAQKEIISIPANPFIPSIRYMKTKLDMYAHIRLRMKSRGQDPVTVEPIARGMSVLDLSVCFPPCHQEMLLRQTMLQNLKSSLRRLEGASYQELYRFIMGNRPRTDERYDEVMFSSMGLGYNIPGLEEFESYALGHRKLLKAAVLLGVDGSSEL